MKRRFDRALRPGLHRVPKAPGRRRLLSAVRAAVVAGMLLAVVVVLPRAFAWADPPRALPANAPDADKRWQPAMDYDTDGCYPTPAIGPDGTVNPGLKLGGDVNGNCRDLSDLENTNAYSRSRCNRNGWCAYMYGLYFEKDQVSLGPGSAGHPNDWEHIVVWVKDDTLSYVSVSQHHSYEKKAAAEVRFEGTHPKIVYHKDGGSTHDFRFATANDEPPENHKHTWQYPDLVGWDNYPPGIRDKLTAADFGAATFALKDQNDTFKKALANARPDGVEFNPDEDYVPVNNPGGSLGVHLRLMPLGDSITYGIGSSDGSGYRARLWDDLAGNNVDFVGSQQSGRVPDPDNEGHSGWVIDQLTGLVKTSLPSYRPNVVTLHIGTNDMNNNVAVIGAPVRLAGLIDQILAAAPDTTVLVATLVPASNSDTEARIAEFNQDIPGVVDKRRSAGKHVRLVDMSAVTTADLADGLHPNDSGYRKMADAFHRGIQDAVHDGWVGEPVAVKPGDPAATCGGERGRWISRGQIASGVAPIDRVRFADIDGDGKDDYLVVDANTGAVQAWLNAGGDTAAGPGWVPRGQIASGVAPGDQIRFADINGDGKDDYLVVDPISGAVQAWLNAGGDSAAGPGWVARGQIASGVAPGSWVHFADIDGDGKADYLVIDPVTGAVQAWLNNGGDPA